MGTQIHPRIITSSSLIGSRVKNSQGENLGKIEDMAVDQSSGQIAYLVLSFGGILGLGDKLFAIPWGLFVPSNTEESVLCLDVDKDILKESPGFDKHHWPQEAESEYLLDVYSYYGYTPYWSN